MKGVTVQRWGNAVSPEAYAAVMSASHAPLVTAVAFQLSAALEDYQMHVDNLVDPWSQREQYDLVSRRFDEVRMLKGALPDLSVAMMEVLISHIALMKALWLSSTVTEINQGSSTDEVRNKHRMAVAAMREQCLRFFSRR
jgi:hypothetical protein